LILNSDDRNSILYKAFQLPATQNKINPISSSSSSSSSNHSNPANTIPADQILYALTGRIPTIYHAPMDESQLLELIKRGEEGEVVLVKMKGREVGCHLLSVGAPGQGQGRGRGQSSRNETVGVGEEEEELGGFKRIVLGVVDRGWKYVEEVYLRDLERGVEWVMVGGAGR
jgi:hypothetical protein